MRGIHRWPVNSMHKGPVTRKMFPFDDVIMLQYTAIYGTPVRILYTAMDISSSTGYVTLNTIDWLTGTKTHQITTQQNMYQLWTHNKYPITHHYRRATGRIFWAIWRKYRKISRVHCTSSVALHVVDWQAPKHNKTIQNKTWPVSVTFGT